MTLAHHGAIVIGAGVAGLSTALYLQRAGIAVAVIDPLPPAGGASFGNAGLLSPDTAVPIALPGMLRKVPGWLLDPLGPLSVKPSYFPRALPWLLRWIEFGTAAPRDGDLGRDARAAPGNADLLEGTTGGGTIWRPDPPDWPGSSLGGRRRKCQCGGGTPGARTTRYQNRKAYCRRSAPDVSRHCARSDAWAAGAGQWLHCQSAAQCAHTRRTVPPGGRHADQRTRNETDPAGRAAAGW